MQQLNGWERRRRSWSTYNATFLFHHLSNTFLFRLLILLPISPNPLRERQWHVSRKAQQGKPFPVLVIFECCQIRWNICIFRHLKVGAQRREPRQQLSGHAMIPHLIYITNEYKHNNNSISYKRGLSVHTRALALIRTREYILCNKKMSME